jgi:hypothetical protein
MRTALNSRGASWRRAVAAAAVAALPLGIVAMTGSPASAHEAPGSPVEVFVDSTASADLADAIQNGWWGHEGANDGTGTAPSFPDVNGSDPDFTSLFPDPSKIRVAFVTTSADGSAEHPAVSAGQSVGQVFGWFMDAGLQTGLNGTSATNDSVNVVSTGAEFNAWDTAGQPVQGFDDSLVLHDVTAPGNPVSTAPKGKSILNRWAAGSHVSLVFYATTGAVDAHGQPIVAVGADGHAITAYMPFTTVQKPGDSIRTSAGYVDTAFGAVAQDTSTTLTTSVPSPQGAGTPIDLTATVAVSSGSDVPVGSVEFFKGATSLGTGSLDGSGVAHLNGVALPAGSYSLTAVYTPQNTQTLAFNTSTSPAVSFTITATSTSVAGSATPGADVTAPVTLTAQVTPPVAGSVVWKEAGVTLEGPVAVDGTGYAEVQHTFSTPGDHDVTVYFTPDSTDYAPGSGTIPTFTLAAPSGVATTTGDLQATVPYGSLTVTTPYTPSNPLDLGTLALTPNLDGYKGSATFEHIRVVDTRDGALPWALTALAGNLTDGSGHYINGQNVGLTGLTAAATSNAGLGTITTHDNAVPTLPVGPSDTGSAGLGGTAHTVFSADHGPSDVDYSGTLTLFAPTTTVTGLYKGTITFTVS